MLDSWWQLGEFGGFSGNTMEVWRITCAFCDEKGNFILAHHAEKKKPNSSKKLNFDVYQCRNCMGYALVLWSAQEFSMGNGLYSFYVLPTPLKKPEPSECWPPNVQRYWTQAHDSLRGDNRDAAVIMARTALQFALRDKGATKGTLYSEIEDLASKGILPPLMKDWSHEVRLLGNDAAHPDAQASPPSPRDAEDIIHFLDSLLMYLYDFPKHVSDYRQRKQPAASS